MDGQRRGDRPSVNCILFMIQFFKRYSMRETPQLGNGYLLLHKRSFNNSVKMPLTRGQSAWAFSSSETQRSAFSSNYCKDQNFINWLVGVVDADGTFSFSRAKKKEVWTFSFQISQSSYNLRFLYYIKQKLQVGLINVVEKNSMAVFRVRDKKHIIEHILPLFDTYPLLTRKHFKYLIFKRAILISNDTKLSLEEKDAAIFKLQVQQNNIPENYKSPAWVNTISLKSKKDAEKIVNKRWLIGFVEAEGSFYLVKKGPARLVHTFEIVQKLDKHVLHAISLVLEIKTGVKQKKTYFTVVTSKQETIEFLISYFFKTMKGMKSLEYRIWARSFNKRHRGFDYLLSIREKMQKIRSIRFDKHWKQVNKKENFGNFNT